MFKSTVWRVNGSDPTNQITRQLLIYRFVYYIIFRTFYSLIEDRDGCTRGKLAGNFPARKLSKVSQFSAYPSAEARMCRNASALRVARTRSPKSI